VSAEDMPLAYWDKTAPRVPTEDGRLPCHGCDRLRPVRHYRYYPKAKGGGTWRHLCNDCMSIRFKQGQAARER